MNDLFVLFNDKLSYKHRSNNGLAFNFGLCLPIECSVHMIEPTLNSLLQQKLSGVSTNLIESTCQSKKSTSDLRNIDIIAM